MLFRAEEHDCCPLMVDLTDIDFAMRMRNYQKNGQDVGNILERPAWLNKMIELIDRLIAKQERSNG